MQSNALFIILLNVIILCVIMMSIIMPSFTMLYGFMLIVVMLSVVLPYLRCRQRRQEKSLQRRRQCVPDALRHRREIRRRLSSAQGQVSMF